MSEGPDRSGIESHLQPRRRESRESSGAESVRETPQLLQRRVPRARHRGELLVARHALTTLWRR